MLTSTMADKPANTITSNKLRAFGLALDALWMEGRGFPTAAQALRRKAVHLSGMPPAQFNRAFEAARAVDE